MSRYRSAAALLAALILLVSAVFAEGNDGDAMESEDLDISFEEKLGKTEETLAEALPAINSKLSFIEENMV